MSWNVDFSFTFIDHHIQIYFQLTDYRDDLLVVNIWWQLIEVTTAIGTGCGSPIFVMNEAHAWKIRCSMFLHSIWRAKQIHIPSFSATKVQAIFDEHSPRLIIYAWIITNGNCVACFQNVIHNISRIFSSGNSGKANCCSVNKNPCTNHSNFLLVRTHASLLMKRMMLGSIIYAKIWKKGYFHRVLPDSMHDWMSSSTLVVHKQWIWSTLHLFQTNPLLLIAWRTSSSLLINILCSNYNRMHTISMSPLTKDNRDIQSRPKQPAIFMASVMIWLI